MAPVVVVVIVLLALAVVGASVVFVVTRGVRHWSRTREQQNVVFAVQMALIGVVQTATQQFDDAAANGQGAIAARPETQWDSAQAKARSTALNHAGLLDDVRLKQLTHQLLDGTGRLLTTRDPVEGMRLRHEVECLHQSFRERSFEVVRDLRLGRASGRR